MCLNTFDQTFETDTATGSRIHKISISSRPRAETWIEQRLQRPTIVCPTQIAVQMLLRRIETHPCSLSRVGKSECIGMCFRTTSIIGGTFILGRTAETHFFREVLSDNNAIIVQVRLYLSMIITGQWNFKLRICLTDYFQRFLHYIHRTLIHRNRTNIKPSFFSQMLGKRSKHRNPHFFISRFSRCCLYKLQWICCLIKILER